MTIEVWEEKDGIAAFPKRDEVHPLLDDDSKFLYEIEGEDWDDCMRKLHEKLGWEPYKPF